MTGEAEILSIFEHIYGVGEGVVVASAPGRVNIIGEHTDYNEGYVLPTPLGHHTWVAARSRGDSEFRLYAHDYRERYSFTLGEQRFSDKTRWANYVMGVVDALRRRGYDIGGADLAIKGDVPQSAGLSSSAALEVATARALKQLFKLDIDPVELAYVGKSAENDFIGLQSGIMDQFCASLGKRGEALFIDCRDNSYRNLKLPWWNTLVAVHTGINRKLDSSAYNERVAQCREGVAALRRVRPEISSLRDATAEDLEAIKGKVPDLIYRRCRHVVSENARVLSAVEAMELNVGSKLGALMYESHVSLRDDYGVSCPELDALVKVAMDTDYVLGARLTGAGFGGCTINLLPIHNLRDFVEEVPALYREATGLDAVVYPVQPQ
ncbi:TPA: galactokinase [Candidatus Bathyarchaeota archaeon]|nr:galactokinase [Candidatus Bathyarchaeota archaeon]